MSQGSLAIFIARPISGVITAVAILFFALPVLTPWWRRLRGVPAVRRAAREIWVAAIADAEFWLRLFSIGVLNLLLAGDNALVIALAVRALAKREGVPRRGWGALRAIVLLP